MAVPTGPQLNSVQDNFNMHSQITKIVLYIKTEEYGPLPGKAKTISLGLHARLYRMNVRRKTKSHNLKKSTHVQEACEVRAERK